MSGKGLVQTSILINARGKHNASGLGAPSEQVQELSLNLLMVGIAGNKMNGNIDRYSLHSISASWVLLNQYHLTRKHTLPLSDLALAKNAAVSRAVISADMFSDCFYV